MSVYRVRLPNFEHRQARAALNGMATGGPPAFELFEAAYPDPNRMELVEMEYGVARINQLRRQMGWTEKPFVPLAVRVGGGHEKGIQK